MLPSLAACSQEKPFTVKRDEMVLKCTLVEAFKTASPLSERGRDGEVRMVTGSFTGEDGTALFAIKRQLNTPKAREEMSKHIQIYNAASPPCKKWFTEPLVSETPDQRDKYQYSLQTWACSDQTRFVELRDILRSRPFPKKLVTMIVEDVGRAWACLHASGYIHNDSHARNVIVCLPKATKTTGGIPKRLQLSGPWMQEATLLGVKLIDMGDVTALHENAAEEAFMTEWTKMYDSIEQNMLGRVPEYEKYIQEFNTKAWGAYSARLALHRGAL